MVTIHLKEQKRSRKPNKHPNSNRDAPYGTKDAADTFRPSIRAPHQSLARGVA